MKNHFFKTLAIFFTLTTTLLAQESTKTNKLAESFGTFLQNFLDKNPKWTNYNTSIYNKDGSVNNDMLKAFSSDFCNFTFEEESKDFSPTLKETIKEPAIVLCKMGVEIVIIENK